MPRKCLFAMLIACFALVAQAKPGIKSIVVFGDSLCDAGNVPIWSLDNPVSPDLLYPSPPYYMGRGSNGPVWIEVAAGAYGYDVSPYLAGGTNFAFAGAETGTGLSDQDSPNFLSQVRMWQNAVTNEEIDPPMPWQLFVIWFGPNDMLRYLVETAMAGELPTREGIEETIATAVQNLATGIVGIHGLNGRMFMVPNMPPLHMTPWGLSQDQALQAVLAAMTDGFNDALEDALVRIENAHDKVTILRLDTYGIMMDAIAFPDEYALEEVFLPALDVSTGTMLGDPDVFLSWDGFHPTAVVHAIIAERAMDVIPIGSWWGHSMARGPDGSAFLGMGWVNDSHWPWVYVYGMGDGGEWMWAIEDSGSLDGFLALIPKGRKWVFVNARTGSYYDYETGTWHKMPTPGGG